MTFLVFKMSLRTLVVQRFYNLRTKLWKVVSTSKNIFKFWALVSTFFCITLIQSTQFFSGSLNIYDSCFWWNIFPIYRRCYCNWECFLLLFPWRPLLRKQIFSTQFCSLSRQTKLSLIKWSQTVRLVKKNCCKVVSSIELQRVMGSKCRKNYFFGFWYH